MESKYRDWLSIDFGVLEASIFGLLLFNIFLAGLFFIVDETDIGGYTDYDTPYVSGNDIEKV